MSNPAFWAALAPIVAAVCGTIVALVRHTNGPAHAPPPDPPPGPGAAP